MPSLPDAKALAVHREAIARHLRTLETQLEHLDALTLDECGAFLACKRSEVVSRINAIRSDASFYRSVLHPVGFEPSEIAPEALPSEWSARLNTPAEGSK